METQELKQSIEEMRQEVVISDVPDRIRIMCLDALDSADECLDVPQCRSSIQAVIATVRTFIRRNIEK